MVSSTAVRSAPNQEKIQDPIAAVSYETASRLMESLLHDARNPLNAIAINLEVLSEKLKDGDGTVAPSYEKNLKAMREQIFRVNAILSQFAEFIAPRPSGGALINLSEVLQKVQEVVGHESRRRRLKVRWNVEPGVAVRCADSGGINQLALHPVMRALLRTEAGGEVEISLSREGELARLKVRDPAGPVADPNPDALTALRLLAERNNAQLRTSGGECELAFPLS